MNIFEFEDYRDFIRKWISNSSTAHGQFAKIARALHMHSTTVSQVIHGKKTLTLDQACALAAYFEMGEMESEYLLTLVSLERAGTPLLRKRLQHKIRSMKKQSSRLANRLPKNTELSEQSKGIFYSHWYYIALALAVDIEGLQTVDSLSSYLSVPRQIVSQAIEFLQSQGVVYEVNGHLCMGMQNTHLELDSPHLLRHHTNWRLRAIERNEKMSQEEELQYTGPFSLSREDARRIRERLLETIQTFLKQVAPSKSETLYCLNIDWFKI